VRDSSRTPTGLPSIYVQQYGANGDPFAINVQEGHGFRVTITGYNVAPNTTIKMYVANVGQNAITPGLRDIIPKAAQAAGCVGTVKPWTQATALQWFNGGTFKFPSTYVSGTPIVMDFIVTKNDVVDPPRQLDILSSVVYEGDIDDFGGTANYAGNWDSTVQYNKLDWVYYVPTGRKYFAKQASKNVSPPTDDGATYENDVWREYVPVNLSGTSNSRQLVDQPPRYWELRATEDGQNITYTIQGPDNSDSTVAFTSANPPAGFDAALQQALSNSGFMSLTNGRLATTNTVIGGGAVTFTVPFAGGGKHTMRLTDVQGTTNPYITIGDACVYLTKPAIDTVRNLYGWNAAGGEFNTLLTPNYTDQKPAAVWANGTPGTWMVYNGGRYYYPSKPEDPDPAWQHQQMDYFYKMGARYMRFPFKMQRLQRQAFGPLYYGNPLPFTKFDGQDMRRVIEASFYWLSTYPDTRIVFDAHDFGEHTYNIVPAANGNPATYDTARWRFDNPDAENRPEALVDFWANKFVPAMLVELPMGRWDLDFQNEPKEVGSYIAPTQWAATMQWLTNAVRARTDYVGICHREMTEYSSATNFAKNGNSEANINSYDPLRNMVFHLHSYNDKDGSGTSGTCVVDAGKSRLVDATNWARNNGFTRDKGYGLFLGETGAGARNVYGQETCGPVIDGELQFLLDNSDVWLGYTWYASGFGVSYPFSLDPSNGNYLDPVHTPNLLLNSAIWKTGNKIPA
jgi:hypothetical protein